MDAYSESTPAHETQKFPKKRLIVCCDGTWNAGDLDNKSLTNVAKIARCISDMDNWDHEVNKDGTRIKNYISQVVHYSPGVGLGTGFWSNIWDGLTGRGESFINLYVYNLLS
jgi:uncharacterized protein (DUF2235 family)